MILFYYEVVNIMNVALHALEFEYTGRFPEFEGQSVEVVRGKRMKKALAIIQYLIRVRG
jgi:hypothetical protein